MELREGFWMALESIRANKFRSFLTTLGIIIGVWAVIGMQTFISGLNHKVEKDLSVLGAGTFYVQKFPAIVTNFEKYRNRKDITLEQVQAVEERATLIAQISPSVYNWGVTVRYRDKKTNPDVIVYGGNEFWPLVSGFFVEEGRFFTRSDVDHRAAVCVLGQAIAEKLFPFEDPLGKEILLEGHRVTVIGIFEEKGSMFGQSQDNLAVIPITTFQKFFGKRQSIEFAARAKDPALMAEAIDQVVGILRTVRKVPPGAPNDFEVLTKDSLMETWRNLTKYVFLGAIIIAGMSLLVGGIGIMNIMLVSVTERTREIGIRKAVGARRSDILGQFITEAIILSSVGGLIGIVVGIASGILLGLAINWPTVIPAGAAVVGFFFSVAVGLFFGIYPAAKASNLNPIEALRYE
jgi:putative ABC transport system permease protein